MNRAAISIVSNLAEGQKRGKKEFHHFINISRGSLAELRVQLDLTKELYKSTENEITMALQIHEEVGKMSWALLLRTATED